jgi:hypothetical protein
VWRAALCCDWRQYVSAGEQAVVILLGADKKQAGILRRYSEGRPMDNKQSPNNRLKKNPLARNSRAPREKTKGSFTKENHPKGGRTPGSKNFITREVKEGIIAACNKIGSDGKGRDGLEGYLEFLGRNFPPVMGGLLRTIMPTQVTVERRERPEPYQTYAQMCADLEQQYGIKLDRPV